jgi:hypothetical protein
MITRRTALGGASASALALVATTARAQTASDLSAVISLNGQTFTFQETAGRDLGDFVSTIGDFTQRCVRTDVGGCPLTVFFRPDRNSTRVEVVVELGKVFSGTPANLGAYNVKIYRGGQLLASVDVPQHYWFSRWRWQSAPRPIKGDVATYISQGLLPPYDRSSATGQICTALLGRPGSTCTTTSTTSATAPAVMTTFTAYTIMGLAGLQAYMPNTGERDDIGLVTEPQAQYICTGQGVPLNALRAQAEAAGTLPWHLRDENTGAPINFRTYSGASWYSESVGSPYIRMTGTPITVDTAHQPAVAYVPYLLTGDPYHLEDLQFQANYSWGAMPPRYRPSIGQSRAFAWHMRSLAQCARMTPAAVPSWLLPQSYWAGFLQQHRQFLEQYYVNDAAPLRSVFRSTGSIDDGRDEGASAPGGTWVDPWQEEFMASVMGWIIGMGFTDWQTAFDWKIGSTIARTGATSGWVRAHATPYRMILRDSRTSPLARSWSEGWDLTRRIAGLAYADPNTWSPQDMTYLTYSRGALAFAAKLGTGGAGENLAWATAQLRNRGWRTAYKWRLGSGL